MARTRGRAAPDPWGAWVDGTYYAPGSFLPRGTSEFRVVAIQNLTGEEGGWRTVHHVFDADYDDDDIEDILDDLFVELCKDYGIKC